MSSRREAIHAREHSRCFYCLRRFFIRGRVLEHVVPQARGGTNSYRNLVSCCVECNSQKGESGAEDFLRILYRLRRLTSAELEACLRALDTLAAGDLRPVLAAPAVVSHVAGAGLAPPAVQGIVRRRKPACPTCRSLPDARRADAAKL